MLLDALALKYILYFDYAAILVFILLIISIFLRHLNKSKSSKVFLVVLIICFIATTFDIISANLLNRYVIYNIKSFDDNFIFSYFIHELYYCFRYLIIFMYVIYILTFTKAMKIVKKSILFMTLLIVPLLTIEALVWTNYFTHLIFELNVDPVTGELSSRIGNLDPLIIFIEGYYLLLVGIHLYRNRKIISLVQLLSFLLIIPIMILSTILRYVYPDLLAEMILISLSLLVIIQNVESPELLIDSRTGLLSHKQFEIAIKREFLYKLKSSVVFINFINLYDAYQKFSYDNANKYIKMLSNLLEQIVKPYQAYSLEEGIGAVIFDDKEKATLFASKIFADMSNTRFSDLNFAPEMAVSIVDLTIDFETYDHLFNYIDNFHNSKSAGVYEYSECAKDMNEFIKVNIESIMDEAFKQNQFRVYYQPIYDINKKTFNYVEALSRIESPTFGIIYPDYFIPYAETKGIVQLIDISVIEKVMILISNNDIKDLGIETITVNLSLVDFSNDDFVLNVLALKDRYKINPKMIKFEITESKDIKYTSNFVEMVNRLIEVGFDFILDDYGTGYSNLERFAKLPIDYVKVDRSIVRLATINNMDDALKSTFNMIHELGRKSFIEGIETEDEYNEFLKYKCHYIQGNYLCPALKEDEFFEFIKEKNINK